MRILIVEDEKVAARGLQRMVLDILGKEISWIGWEASLDASRLALAEKPVDILFLDLNLNGENGFELLQGAVAGSFHTIVVSANEDQALRAFEYGVLDFVPKPVSGERLQKAIARVKDANYTGKHAKFLPIRKPKGVALIRLDDVSYFRGEGNNVEIRLKCGVSEYHRQTLESLAKVLPTQFSRIHRSYIVDTRDVKGVVAHGGGRYEIILISGTKLPLSRIHYKDFKNVSLS
ncbi:MAG: LytTR family DNA-binding domain-containing protein [Fibrobacteria bacterium]